MPSTTNFGWTTPADTDYVKDGASAIRTLAGGIDTSMAQLKGGTSGQILSKTNGTDMAFTWINNDQGDLTAITAGTGISVTSGTGPIPTVAIDTATTVDKTTAQTLTNKTLTSPVISSISNTGTITLPTSTDTLVGRATTDTLTNKTISATSNTLSGVINNTLTTTTGDLIYASSANTPARLAIGSTNQVLTVSGGVPTWASAASGGGFTLITDTQASASASVNFTSISGTYKHLLLTWEGLRSTTDTSTQYDIRLNADSGSNYNYRGFSYVGTTATDKAGQGTSVGYGNMVIQGGQGTGQSELSMGFLWIFDYASTNRYKLCIGASSYYDQGYGARYFPQVLCNYASTSAITSVDITRIAGSGNLTNGTNTSIRLYGVS
jgi:hypothetical protein